jgi:phosphoribosylformimino-5-aminoimidazole carboxamide ribotide isomerase
MLEVGGGVRSDVDVRELFDVGVDRLVVGTALARSTEAVREWVKHYGPRFIAGIDARYAEVRVSGWEEGSKLRDNDLAEKAAAMGLVSVVYTSIDRDGTKRGPDIEHTRPIAQCGLPVILSGGIGSIEHVRLVARAAATATANRSAAGPGIVGVIAGRAIYDGTLDLARAFAEFPPTSADCSAW